jgi:hypothetical protein
MYGYLLDILVLPHQSCCGRHRFERIVLRGWSKRIWAELVKVLLAFTSDVRA